MGFTWHLYTFFISAAIGMLVCFMRVNGVIGKKIALSFEIPLTIISGFLLYSFSVSGGEKDYTKEVDAHVMKNPMMQVLNQYDQKSFYRLRDKIIAMKNDNNTDQQVFNELLIDFIKIQKGRSNFATDQDIISLARLIRDQIVYAKGVSDDFCFRFLYPSVSGGIQAWLEFPESILTKRNFLEAAMVRNSYGVNKHIITSDEASQAKKDYDNMEKQLNLKYGTDLEIVADPGKGMKKKKIACEISEDMLNYMLALPAERTAGIYRQIISLN